MTRARSWSALLTAIALPVALWAPTSAQAQSAKTFCNGHLVTISGTPGDDVIHGTSGRDVIAALGGNDVIDGRGSDDVICGGPGNDRISGGSGKDQLLGGSGNDVIHGDNGDDAFIDGNAGHNRLYGDAGDDAIWAKGSNSVFGGPGADSVFHFDSNDRVNGGPGDDWLEGIFRVGAGPTLHQLVRGGTGHNGLGLEVRRPEAASQAPFAHVLVNLGSGLLRADGTIVRLVGIYTRVTIRQPGEAEAWTLSGTPFDDHLTMGDSATPIPVTEKGLAGDDYLIGGSGDDLLRGGPGFDRAWGAGGTNTCSSIEGPVGLHPDESCQIVG